MKRALQQERQLLRDDRARWGLPKALYALAMRSLNRFFGFRVALVLCRPLYDDTDLPQPPPGYVVRLMTDADHEEAIANPAFNVTQEFVDAALADGGLCYAAYNEHELVAYVWRAFGEAPADNSYRLRIQRPLRYAYKAVTLPAHRGLHLQSRIALSSDRYCIELGYTQGASYIETHNFPSIRGDIRRGAKRVGWIVWLSKGPLRWCYTSPGSRKAGVELYDPLRS